MKDRIKFTVAGTHYLLYVCRDRLIQQGFALVPWSDNPDFCLYGAELCGEDFTSRISKLSLEIEEVRKVPLFVLSSSSVYTDKTPAGAMLKPMVENQATLVASGKGPRVLKGTYSILAELLIRTQQPSNMILRPFNIYGPNVQTGVIPKLFQQSRNQKPLTLSGSTYQTRSFLYEDDWFKAFDKLLVKFLQSSKGIYNVGSTEEVALRHLATSVWQLTNGTKDDTPVEVIPTMDYIVNWKLPDVSKIVKLINWKPSITLRKGLWLMTDV